MYYAPLLASVTILALVVVGGLVRLLTLAIRLGSTANKIEETQKELSKRMSALDVLPSLVIRLGNLESIVAHHQSDIRDLKEKVLEVKK